MELELMNPEGKEGDKIQRGREQWQEGVSTCQGAKQSL